MNRIGTIALLGVSFAVLNAGALEAKHSPYDKIAGRNVFQLHAPVVVNVEVPPKTPSLRKATLTGITTILGRSVAFITIEGIKSQLPESVMIGKGQAVNGIEVEGIDEKAGLVRILNDGKVQILNFEPAKASGLQSDQGLRTAPLSSLPAQARPEAAMTPEEQTALIELQRIRLASNDKDLAAP